MVKEVTAIRFTSEEKAWIQSYADVLGQSFSEFVRQAALEKVEDAADLCAYQEAVKNHAGTRLSLQEVLNESEKSQ